MQVFQQRGKKNPVASVFWFKLSCLVSIVFAFLAKHLFFFLYANSPATRCVIHEATASLSHNLPKREMVLVLTFSGSYDTETKNYYALIP